MLDGDGFATAAELVVDRRVLPGPSALLRLAFSERGVAAHVAALNPIFKLSSYVVAMNVQAKSSFLEELDQAILSGIPAKRERALWAATDMFMVGRYTDEEVWVFGEIIGRLAAEIELAARAKLAEKLSRIEHAPPQLIGKFAADPSAEIAGPVLQYSKQLDVRALGALRTHAAEERAGAAGVRAAADVLRIR
jgi:hypothetical protein